MLSPGGGALLEARDHPAGSPKPEEPGRYSPGFSLWVLTKLTTKFKPHPAALFPTDGHRKGARDRPPGSRGATRADPVGTSIILPPRGGALLGRPRLGHSAGSPAPGPGLGAGTGNKERLTQEPATTVGFRFSRRLRNPGLRARTGAGNEPGGTRPHATRPTPSLLAGHQGQGETLGAGEASFCGGEVDRTREGSELTHHTQGTLSAEA